MLNVRATLTISVVLRDGCTPEEMRSAVLAEVLAVRGDDLELSLSAPFDASPAVQQALAILEPATAAAVFAASGEVTGLQTSEVPQAMPEERGSEEPMPDCEGSAGLCPSSMQRHVAPYFKRKTWDDAAFQALLTGNSEPEGERSDAALAA